MAAIHRVYKTPNVVKEPHQIEDGTKPKRVSPKLSQDNTVWSVSITSDNPTEEKDLDPLDRYPVRIQKRRSPNHKVV